MGVITDYFHFLIYNTGLLKNKNQKCHLKVESPLQYTYKSQ